jgi:hypothetical protein
MVADDASALTTAVHAVFHTGATGIDLEAPSPRAQRDEVLTRGQHSDVQQAERQALIPGRPP